MVQKDANKDHRREDNGRRDYEKYILKGGIYVFDLERVDQT